MRNISAHDQRQLNQMLDVIELFLRDQVGIQGLVGTLSFLLENLEFAPKGWKETFRQKWGLLEILNAEARETRRQLREAELQYAKEVTAEIKKLVENMMSS